MLAKVYLGEKHALALRYGGSQSPIWPVPLCFTVYLLVLAFIGDFFYESCHITVYDTNGSGLIEFRLTLYRWPLRNLSLQIEVDTAVCLEVSRYVLRVTYRSFQRAINYFNRLFEHEDELVLHSHSSQVLYPDHIENFRLLCLY